MRGLGVGRWGNGGGVGAGWGVGAVGFNVIWEYQDCFVLWRLAF